MRRAAGLSRMSLILKIGSKALALACGAIFSFSLFAQTVQSSLVEGVGVVTWPGGSPEGACRAMGINADFHHFVLEAPTSARCYFDSGGTIFSPGPASGQLTCSSLQVAGNGICFDQICPDTTYELDPAARTCTKHTCPDGQYYQSGQCRCENGAAVGTDGVTCCPAIGSGNAGASMQWCYVNSPSATSCESTGNNGCAIRCNNVTFQTGGAVQIFPREALGQNCTYTGNRGSGAGGGGLSDEELKNIDDAVKDPDKANSPAECLASGQGYVSGSTGTHCVPSGDTGVVKKESTTKEATDNANQTTNTEKSTEHTSGPGGTGSETVTETTTNPDGSTTTTKTTTTKNPDGTVTTEKTSTTTDGEGNETGKTAEKSNEPASDFCAKNPESPLCVGLTDECKDHPDRIGCLDKGDPPAEGSLDKTEIGLHSITAVFLPSGSSSCPSGPDLPFGVGPMPLTGICSLASGIKPIVILLAWISVGLMLFRSSD